MTCGATCATPPRRSAPTGTWPPPGCARPGTPATTPSSTAGTGGLPGRRRRRISTRRRRREGGVKAVATPVCEMPGIEQPIVLAAMVSVPELAAAVSNAGALGMLTLTWSGDVGAVIRETAALTTRPFCGNLVLTEDRHDRLGQALEAGLRIVSFFLGDPGGYVEQVHDAGGIVMHTVGTAEEARRAVASGVGVIVAQGWEAGGHVWGTVATLPLVPAVVDAVAPVPVIAAGGIGDARGVAAVLALGAQAAWLGTRFLLAEEMPIHQDYRRRLIAAAETDSQWYPDLYESVSAAAIS